MRMATILQLDATAPFSLARASQITEAAVTSRSPPAADISGMLACFIGDGGFRQVHFADNTRLIAEARHYHITISLTTIK